MTETANNKVNSALWLGAVLLIAAVVTNIPALFSAVPAPRALPLLTVLLAILAVFFCVKALRRSQTNPEMRRSKAAGWTLSVLAVLLLASSLLFTVVARKLPPPGAAPQVGQKAPDFSLRDTKGVPVTLAQLLSSPMPDSTEKPKAVLLIFYRGYW